jgi:hypothetical protein
MPAISWMRVGLLNCLEYPELSEKQSVYVSEFGTQCAVLIFIEGREPHVSSAAYNEMPVSLHHWNQGILGVGVPAHGHPRGNRRSTRLRHCPAATGDFSRPEVGRPGDEGTGNSRGEGRSGAAV